MSRDGTEESSKPKRPKAKLGLPDLDHSKSAALDSLRSAESKRGYRHAIDGFMQWYCVEPRLSFNKVVATRYRIFFENRQLAAGAINGRVAAVRRLAYEGAEAGLLSPELAAGIRRVKGGQEVAVRLGNWLTAEQARCFWQSPAAQDPDFNRPYASQNERSGFLVNFASYDNIALSSRTTLTSVEWIGGYHSPRRARSTLGLDNIGDPVVLYGAAVNFTAGAGTPHWPSVARGTAFPPQWGWTKFVAG